MTAVGRPQTQAVTRAFADIEAELGLNTFLPSDLGTLHFTPITRERPTATIVRRFSAERAGRAAAWARLTDAAAAWIAVRPTLAAVLRVEPLTKVGSDFVARGRFEGTSLAAYADDDDPPEAPPELAVLRRVFLELATAAPATEAPVVALLARSLLSPTHKTVYDYGAELFVIGEIKPTAQDLDGC